MVRAHQIVPQAAGITCHAWNSTGDMLALCPNNNELHIYEGCNSADMASWRRAHVLAEHDMIISGISWSHANNKIVTCSHDRNAFVWKFDAAANRWVPTLCVLRIDRAALSVEWSPDGTKFAVGSGSKSVPVCFHDNSQYTDWYVSKMIKKHKSTVIQVAWHPNSQIIATVCSDRRCRVISATMQEVDATADAGPFGQPAAFGEVYPNAEYPCAGWAVAAAWSPSGTKLCFAAHDSSIHIVDYAAGGTVCAVNYSLLPLSAVMFLGEGAVVGGGHDMEPLLFSRDAQGGWAMKTRLDTDFSASRKGSQQAAVTKISAARAMFQAKTTRGEEASDGVSATFKTTHRNAITCIRAVPSGGGGGGGGGGQFSTTALDGQIAMWETSSLNVDMGALRI
ncbi:actin-related protein 2/3 complex subunit ARPC1B or p41-Arc [Tribonema minus]|uniref:Arp2/3 complex 41 kDa subunit n=1 Tax=Tribonema minus TaxID=303371 RepID=A0A836CE76_9STRA|nr:actin-related protein 2/3 complex subunit ARPC1B or p41-Arc [Tribonema minus]